jgi:hypothetical protein
MRRGLIAVLAVLGLATFGANRAEADLVTLEFSGYVPSNWINLPSGFPQFFTASDQISGRIVLDLSTPRDAVPFPPPVYMGASYAGAIRSVSMTLGSFSAQGATNGTSVAYVWDNGLLNFPDGEKPAFDAISLNTRQLLSNPQMGDWAFVDLMLRVTDNTMTALSTDDLVTPDISKFSLAEWGLTFGGPGPTYELAWIPGLITELRVVEVSEPNSLLLWAAGLTTIIVLKARRRRI